MANLELTGLRAIVGSFCLFVGNTTLDPGAG